MIDDIKNSFNESITTITNSIDISEKIFPDQWLAGKDNLLKIRMNFINDSFDDYEIFRKQLNLENGNK